MKLAHKCKVTPQVISSTVRNVLTYCAHLMQQKLQDFVHYGHSFSTVYIFGAFA